MGTAGWIVVAIGVIILVVALVAFQGRKTLAASYREEYTKARQIHAVDSPHYRARQIRIIADSLVTAVKFRQDVRVEFINSLFPEGEPLPAPITNQDIDDILVGDSREAEAALWTLSSKLYNEANTLGSTQL